MGLGYIIKSPRGAFKSYNSGSLRRAISKENKSYYEVKNRQLYYHNGSQTYQYVKYSDSNKFERKRVF